MLNDPFKITLVDSIAAAKNEINTRHYTILNPANVYRSPKELLEIVAATGAQRLLEVAAYRPERHALHWLAAHLSLAGKFDTDSDFEIIAKEVHQKYISPDPEIKSLIDAIKIERAHIERKVARILGQGSDHNLTKKDEETALVKTVLTQVESRINDGLYTPGQHNPTETVESVVGKIATDQIYNASCLLTDTLSKAIKNKVRLAKENGVFLPLPEGGGQFVWIAAAPGSGKSTLTSFLEPHFFPHGAAILTEDNFRRFLLDNPEESIQAVGSIGKLSRDEISEIKAKVLTSFLNLVRSGDKLPTVVYEQTIVSDFDYIHQILTELGKRNKTAHYFSLHVPAETAMERALKRSYFPTRVNDAAKLIEPEIMIRLHQHYGDYFEKILLGNLGQDLDFSLLNNDVPKGTMPVVVATGNTRLKKLTIYDVDCFIASLKKRFLNVHARDASELMKNDVAQENMAIKDIMTDLAQHYSISFRDSKNKEPFAEISPDGFLRTYEGTPHARHVQNPVLALFERVHTTLRLAQGRGAALVPAT